MLAQPAQDLETPRSSIEIVSKILSQTSAASTFLKNAGIETPVSKSASSAAREAQCREQLQAEKQRADLLQEVDTLKKKAEEIEESMARTQKVVLKTQQKMEEFKKKQEVNVLLLQRILILNSGNRAT
jgi:peptidoglycan hydrolase CwlO-like protein